MPSVNPFELDDPNDIIASDQATTQKGLSSSDVNTRNASLGALFSRVVNGDPRAQKAQATQDAVMSAQQLQAPQGPDESDMDYQIRQAHATYQAVSGIDVNAAQKVADHIITLQQAKQQQQLLQTDIQDKQQTATIQRQTQGTFVVGSSDGTKEYGSVSRFNDDGTPNPNFSSQVAALQQQNPGSQIATQQQWFANRAAVAAQKEAARAAAAQAKLQASGANDPDAVKYLAGQSVLDQSAYARQTPEMRNAANVLKLRSGITPMDEAQARLQYTFLKNSAAKGGARDGNVQTLRNSMSTLGSQVLATLQGVDRTNIAAVNSAIAAGKTQFSDPGEARYAAAVQGLVTEYGRVLAGGSGGVTSDSARDEAHAILSTAKGADAVKAVVDQISNKETAALAQASDRTLEYYANPRQYSAINKVQSRLGFQIVDGDNSNVVQTPATVNHDLSGPDQKTLGQGPKPPKSASGSRVVNFSDLAQ